MAITPPMPSSASGTGLSRIARTPQHESELGIKREIRNAALDLQALDLQWRSLRLELLQDSCDVVVARLEVHVQRYLAQPQAAVAVRRDQLEPIRILLAGVLLLRGDGGGRIARLQVETAHAAALEDAGDGGDDLRLVVGTRDPLLCGSEVA